MREIDLPRGWSYGQLGHSLRSLADGPFGSNLASKHYTDTGARVVRLGNVGVGRFKDEDRAFISLERYKNFARHVVSEGDVIIAGLGDSNNPLGRACLAPPELGPAIVKADCFRVRVDSDRLDARFLVHFLNSSLGEWGCKQRSRGSTRQRMNLRDVASLMISRPGLDDQRRIADFLDAKTGILDRLVAMRGAGIGLLRQREQALLDASIDSMIEEYGTLPLRRFLSRVEQGVSPQCDSLPAEEGEWGVLKVSAVKGGRFDGAENKRLPEEVAPHLRYEVRDRDLLITRANTPALVGAVAVAEAPRARLMLPDKIFRIEVTEDLNKNFFALVARGSRIRGLCAAASHGTSQSMANLKIEEIKSWPVPLAPTCVQADFVDRFEAAARANDELVQAIATQIELLEERRRALITAAVTGQIDVTTAQRCLPV